MCLDKQLFTSPIPQFLICVKCGNVMNNPIVVICSLISNDLHIFGDCCKIKNDKLFFNRLSLKILFIPSF